MSEMKHCNNRMHGREANGVLKHTGVSSNRGEQQTRVHTCHIIHQTLYDTIIKKTEQYHNNATD